VLWAEPSDVTPPRARTPTCCTVRLATIHGELEVEIEIGS